MKLQHVILISALIVFACEHSPNQASGGNGLATGFVLQNPGGEETNTFRVGEDIRLEYVITNETGQQQPYMIPDAGPFVKFEILQPGNSFGSSLDGLAFIPVITVDTLAAGSTLSAMYNWYSATEHDVLSEGSYIARAIPRLNFSETTTPGSQQIEFTIISENAQMPDTTDIVAITDLPPDSLQLHPFTLNNGALAGDILTLNVTYSGGCQEHDLQLFMSPAAFMESYPVQAALYLRHNDHNDPCDALITTELRVNVRPIAELYRQQYGGLDTIILKVFPYFENTPSDPTRIRYTPQ